MKHIHLAPLALFATYFIKLCFSTASYPEAIILTALGLITCYFQSKDNDKKLKALDEKLSAAVKTFEEKDLEIKKIKETVNSLKLGSIVRPAANVSNR